VIISAYEKNMSHIELKVEFVKKRIEYLMTEVERTSNVPLTKCVKKYGKTYALNVSLSLKFLSHETFMHDAVFLRGRLML
jgi:hypothetical protein